MPKARRQKRKTPVTVDLPARSAVGPTSSSNPHSTRTLIRRFHVLLKRKDQLSKLVSNGHATHLAETKAELASVEMEMEALGGLQAYQKMSTIGQGSDRGGGSEKVFIEWLKEIGLSEYAHKSGKQLQMLEVGALKPDNYASCSSWIHATPIDLRSQHPSIREQDFLLMDETENSAQWDAISLSLVVNFVPDANDRGRMLVLAHSFLRSEGHLFLALPLPCILNSRYMTPDHMHGLMSLIGFDIVKNRWKDGGKMAYWLFRKTPRCRDLSPNTLEPYEKKQELRQGKNRNNFAILLQNLV